MATALSPYRVLDLSTDRAWMCGKMLADLGADVIKVEPPGGDRGRLEHRPPGLAGGRGSSEDTRWLFQNRGKRSVVIDLDDAAGRAQLLALVDGADVVVESFPPGWLEARGLGPEALLERNPRLVVTSVSPFGRTGPYAGFEGPDLVVAAMCGLMWLTGDPDRPPLRVSVPQMYRHAGAEAAAQTLIALHHASRTGEGQHVDVSAQLAGIRTVMNAQAFHLLEGGEIRRMGTYAGYTHPRFRMVLECLDGHMAMLVTGGRLGGPMMRHLFDWAEREGVGDAGLAAIDFESFNFADVDRKGAAEARRFFDRLSDTIGRLFAKHTKGELYELALERLMLLAPVTTVADLRADEQLAARGYFVPVDHDGRPVAYAGPWARLAATPLRDSPRAPAVGEHTAEVLAEARRPAPNGQERASLPFEGLKVLDLSWVGVGPMTAGYLANYGATVVKVESSRSPDILRLTPPFRDGVPGLNNSHFCANMNASKLGLGLDLSRPEGRDIVLRLAEWADVVFESFTPKTLRGWGLDYEALRARNPGLIMLSTCMQGQTGPRANYRGFGNLMGALSGYYEVTGWPDRGPTSVYGAYTDFICQRFCTTAVVAAIDHRQRTGEGQHIDVAQFEAALQFLGPELLDFELTGRAATRAGNRDPWCAPHGVFPCRPRPDGNEGWIAIACETDEQWAALCRHAGFPIDEALATVAGRKADEDRVEAMVAAWTAGHDATELFERLQPEVPCGPALPVPALHTDPQIRHRGYWWPLVHTVMGEVPYDGLAATMSLTPGRLSKAGPCLGEDSYAVLTELAGLDADAVAQLIADEVVEITG